MFLAEMIALVLVVYAGLGVLFAIPFVLRGAGAIDPAAKLGTRGFRLLIVPGSAALWPWLLTRWLRARSATRTES